MVKSVKSIRLLVLVCCWPLFVALVPNRGKTAPEPGRELEIRVEKGVTYATVGRDKLLLDIAIPPGEGPFPCIVMLHGGAWQGGSRKEFSVGEKDKNGKIKPSWIETIAARGYVTAAISYRLAPKYQFPAMIEDARAAVRFLRAHAANYHIDPDKFGAMGFSAGAHLALLMGLCDKSAGFDVGDHLDTSGQVQCVVDFFGPTDLSLYASSPGLEDGYMTPFLGKECKTDPNIYKKASPLTYVSKNAPPILILHGTFDLIVPAKHSEKLLKALTDAGATAELISFPFAGHGGWDRAEMERAQVAAFKFLDTYLKGKK
jgi:acetyl esterase/lipase